MNDRQLTLISEFVSICNEASIEWWLRGGWAMDFFLRRVTREHEDIDLFVWARDAGKLARELRRAGFSELGGPPPDQQRDFMKDGIELQIALLEKNARGEIVVAGGPWAGEPWPEGMLASSPGRIGDVVCPIIAPRVQIEIKETFPEWRPDLPRYDKHQADIARLREALAHEDDQAPDHSGQR